jgi:predicted nucleotidyltransferase
MRLAMAARTDTLDPTLAEARAGAAHPHQAPRLRARGITSLSLLGSIARGEAGPKSDIDLLIETDPTARFGFFELFELQEELEPLPGRPVPFAFGSAMRPWLRQWIEDDRIEEGFQFPVECRRLAALELETRRD